MPAAAPPPAEHATTNSADAGTPVPPDAAVGAQPGTAPAPESPSCERHSFPAHARTLNGTLDTSPFRVPAGAEQVMLFYYRAPWDSERQALNVHFAFDNPRIVHHWAFYATNAPLSSGEVLDNNLPSDVLRINGDNRQFVIGGGGRSTDVTMPKDVGLRLPNLPNQGFMLEMHYLNLTQDDETDASGMELCVTSTPQPIEAALHTLGKGNFTLPPRSVSEVTATCTPSALTQPVHMFAISPHMHDRGRRSLVTLQRGGQQSVVLDKPFDVHNQLAYTLPVDASAQDILLQPGDTLTTTCELENSGPTPILSGGAADQEMCLMLVWAWPADLLNNGLSATPEFTLPTSLSCTEP